MLQHRLAEHERCKPKVKARYPQHPTCSHTVSMRIFNSPSMVKVQNSRAEYVAPGIT